MRIVPPQHTAEPIRCFAAAGFAEIAPHLLGRGAELEIAEPDVGANCGDVMGHWPMANQAEFAAAAAAAVARGRQNPKVDSDLPTRMAREKFNIQDLTIGSGLGVLIS